LFRYWGASDQTTVFQAGNCLTGFTKEPSEVSIADELCEVLVS